MTDRMIQQAISQALTPIFEKESSENSYGFRPGRSAHQAIRSYLSRTLQLANLAPDIVKLIWENRQPETLTLDKLRKGIPESWEEQRKLFLS
ncbi:MAG: hypothetical protein E7054_03120 [Lentisphaerae bacterium]|nr:hypothetical protein [Lentisphaerota bacterium]